LFCFGQSHVTVDRLDLLIVSFVIHHGAITVTAVIPVEGLIDMHTIGVGVIIAFSLAFALTIEFLWLCSWFLIAIVVRAMIGMEHALAPNIVALGVHGTLGVIGNAAVDLFLAADFSSALDWNLASLRFFLPSERSLNRPEASVRAALLQERAAARRSRLFSRIERVAAVCCLRKNRYISAWGSLRGFRPASR
jgi:hypothetical protein